MRHKFLVLTVKKLLKSVYSYRSYRKIKTGLSLFWTTLYSYRINHDVYYLRPVLSKLTIMLSLSLSLLLFILLLLLLS